MKNQKVKDIAKKVEMSLLYGYGPNKVFLVLLFSFLPMLLFASTEIEHGIKVGFLYGFCVLVTMISFGLIAQAIGEYFKKNYSGSIFVFFVASGLLCICLISVLPPNT